LQNWGGGGGCGGDKCTYYVTAKFEDVSGNIGLKEADNNNDDDDDDKNNNNNNNNNNSNNSNRNFMRLRNIGYAYVPDESV